jgi:hypothetical protein
LKEEAIKQKEEELRQKEEERRMKETFAVKLAHQMKLYGASVDEIKKETGLSAKEIKGLLA